MSRDRISPKVRVRTLHRELKELREALLGDDPKVAARAAFHRTCKHVLREVCAALCPLADDGLLEVENPNVFTWYLVQTGSRGTVTVQVGAGEDRSPRLSLFTGHTGYDVSPRENGITVEKWTQRSWPPSCEAVEEVGELSPALVVRLCTDLVREGQQESGDES